MHSRAAAGVYCAQCAASIIHIFDKIPKASPRYTFAFMNPILSSTMILYSLTLQHPALRALHGITIMSAMSSLITYCQTIWVSGKMIRTVSRLNNMVLGTFSGGTGRITEAGPAREQKQPHSILYGETTHPQDAQGGSTSSSGRTADGVAGYSMPNANMARERHPTMGMGIEAFSAGENQSVGLSSTAPVFQQRSSDGFTEWSTNYTNAEFMSLPEWATTDFGFEQGFGGFETGHANAFTGADMCGLDNDWAQLLGDFS